MKEDRGHRRRTRQGPCCRDRSCSSRTSRCPPRSCSSRTPCSTPATATVEAAVFGIKHYLRHQGVLCTVQVEKIWLEADSTAEEKDDGPCPWWSNLAQWSRLLGKRHKHSEKWKVKRHKQSDGEKHDVRKRGGVVICCSNLTNLLTFVVSDEAGPVAKVLVAFDNLLLPVIVTLQKWTWKVKISKQDKMRIHVSWFAGNTFCLQCSSMISRKAQLVVFNCNYLTLFSPI